MLTACAASSFGKPRRRFPDVVMPPPLALERAAEFLPADIYVGSGLSYEAGLPTLCDMHLVFGVDNPTGTQFAVGEDDLLPARLASDLPDAIGSFCAVHVGALRAPPTPAMYAIALLQGSGLIRKVFTDNVDNMLTKVSVPFERTRGSGVFLNAIQRDLRAAVLLWSASRPIAAASFNKHAQKACRSSP
jgi:hypothetical protein